MSAATFEQVASPGLPQARRTQGARRAGGAQHTAAGRQPSQRALHLTRRGRVVVVTLAILVALAVGMVGGRATATTPQVEPAVVTHTVAAGESLWTIAAGIAAPGADVRDAISEIVALNGLASSEIHVGQQIVVPAQGG